MSKEGMPSPFHSGSMLLPDDDTFAPPALSAYSIALLSESDPQGLDSIPLKENHQLRNSLKLKLSVHFRNETNTEPNEGMRQNGSLNTSTGNLSYSNLSHNLSHNLSGHNLSYHSTSAHSMNQSTGNTSYSSSSNIQHEDDLMDGPAESLAKSANSVSTTPGGSVTLSSLVRPTSSGYSGAKRLRLTRRFNALGPPKRASEVEDASHQEQQILPRESDEKHLLPQTDEQNRYKRPLSISPILKSTSRTHTNSEFLKSLQRLLSPENVEKNGSNTSREKTPDTNHERYELPKLRFRGFGTINENASSDPKQPFARPTSSRIPLTSISPNIQNLRAGDFRKPRTPKAVDPAPAVQRISPPPLASTTSTMSSYSQQDSYDDAKRRKIIQINSQQYEKLELLGRGGTSKVYKVRSIATKQTLAIKKVMFDQFDESCVKGFKGEIDLLTKLKEEPRVVRLVDHTISEGSIYLVMECGDSDLAQVLQTKLNLEKKVDLNFVKFHAMEVLRCVEAVHRAGIVHSDLKPANFLFVKGVMKIIDFGIANAVPDHTANIYRESQIGTPNYMAPEALVEVNHTLSVQSSNGGNTWKVGKPSDIWSCGCIIYQMIYGRPPYGSYTGQLRITAIMNPQVKIEYPSRGVGGTPVPQSSIELMQMCLARNPNERWTVEQCMNSDFLRPKAVSRAFVKDLVYSAVNFGCQSRENVITDEVYEKLVQTVMRQIEDLNYA